MRLINPTLYASLFQSRSRTILPLSSIIRPTLLAVHNPDIRIAAKAFFKSLVEARQVFFLLFTLLCVVSVMGVMLLSGDFPKTYDGPSFEEVRLSFLTIFILMLTNENYPDVMWTEQTANSPSAQIFLMATTIIGIFFIIALLIASFQSTYSISYNYELMRTKVKTRVGAVAAFIMLDLDQTGLLTPQEYTDFFSLLHTGVKFDLLDNALLDVKQFAEIVEKLLDRFDISLDRDLEKEFSKAQSRMSLSIGGHPWWVIRLKLRVLAYWYNLCRFFRKRWNKSKKNLRVLKKLCFAQKRGQRSGRRSTHDNTPKKKRGSRDVSSNHTFTQRSSISQELGPHKAIEMTLIKNSAGKSGDSEHFSRIAEELYEKKRVGYGVHGRKSAENQRGFTCSIKRACRMVWVKLIEMILTLVLLIAKAFILCFDTVRMPLRTFFCSRWYSIMLVIVLLVQLWLMTSFGLIKLYNEKFIWISIATLLHVVEPFLKIIALGWHRYVNDSRHRIDAFIAVAIAVLVVLGLAQTNFVWNPTEHDRRRFIFALPLLRLFNWIVPLRQQLFAFALLLPMFYGIGLLLFVILYMYAVSGVLLFGDGFERLPNPPDGTFSSFNSALLLLFQCVVGEDWEDFMYAGMQIGGLLSSVYFVSFMVITTILFVNLFIGVICDAYVKIIEKQKELGVKDASRLDLASTVWDELLDPDGEEVMLQSGLNQNIDAEFLDSPFDETIQQSLYADYANDGELEYSHSERKSLGALQKMDTWNEQDNDRDGNIEAWTYAEEQGSQEESFHSAESEDDSESYNSNSSNQEEDQYKKKDQTHKKTDSAEVFVSLSSHTRHPTWLSTSNSRRDLPQSPANPSMSRAVMAVMSANRFAAATSFKKQSVDESNSGKLQQKHLISSLALLKMSSSRGLSDTQSNQSSGRRKTDNFDSNLSRVEE